MKKTILLLLIVLHVISCKTKQKTESHQTKTEVEVHQTKDKHNEHWGYTGALGAENWSHISEKYKDCDGLSQSPINIDETRVTIPENLNYLNVEYKISTTNIVNNGHTVQFNMDSGNRITYNNKIYQLKQFHLYSLSEHTVNGKHAPLEIHFVNKAEDGTYAVIGVFFEEGEESSFFNKYLQKMPSNVGDFSEEGKLDILEILPKTKHFYHYKGSFTTPPCTEVVEWIILKDKMTASKKQLEYLHHLLDDNYRPIQKINDRKIESQ